MEPPPHERTGTIHLKEGSVTMDLTPSGGEKGPGTKSTVFYNPSMVMNRDLSVLLLSSLLERGCLPRKEKKDILDGLCGSGIRVIRFFLEVGDNGGNVKYSGCDRELEAVEHARRTALANGANIDLFNEDLNAHLVGRRYSYIDVDPFGSPVPFVPGAISSLLSGGVLALTATDTAALTGSARKASFRRYWTNNIRTEHLHEISCRVLTGYLARCASTLDRGIQPLLVYSSDHYVRGYFRMTKGGSKADASIRNMGYLALDPPRSPMPIAEIDEIASIGPGKRIIGPLWLGPLEEPDILGDALERLRIGARPTAFLKTARVLEMMLTKALDEHGLPPCGYDLNTLASWLKLSPPPMEKVLTSLRNEGHRASRTRFSHTIFRTDAPYTMVENVFKGHGNLGGR